MEKRDAEPGIPEKFKFQLNRRTIMKTLTMNLLLAGLLLIGTAGTSFAIVLNGGEVVKGAVYESCEGSPNCITLNVTP